MEKEKVESLVKELMKRLCMDNNELEYIMQEYTAKKFMIPFRLLKKAITNMGIETEIKKLEKETEDELPESAKMVYFPWDDVIDSMMEHHEEVHFCDKVCPDCGNRLINIEFWSPTSTWVALCGRSDPMTLCVHCPKQIGFSLRFMN